MRRPTPEQIQRWMAAPTPPDAALAAELSQAATLARASNTAACLDLVAGCFERPRAEVRQLSRRDLEHETARAIVQAARLEADRLLRATEDPPAGDDAFAAATRAIYQRRKAEAEAKLNADAEAAFARKIAAR